MKINHTRPKRLQEKYSLIADDTSHGFDFHNEIIDTLARMDAELVMLPQASGIRVPFEDDMCSLFEGDICNAQEDDSPQYNLCSPSEGDVCILLEDDIYLPPEEYASPYDPRILFGDDICSPHNYHTVSCHPLDRVALLAAGDSERAEIW